MTVEQLIEFLSTLPKDMKVLTVQNMLGDYMELDPQMIMVTVEGVHL